MYICNSDFAEKSLPIVKMRNNFKLYNYVNNIMSVEEILQKNF